ncbi:polyphenol oxidase family protein [uncultured Duncaniella sp.]|uniref:polyphenol oxidase family protein n=1 Tax=uncultured Duncaniella sp. TaxID=2768039 RepID=UPI00321FB873
MKKLNDNYTYAIDLGCKGIRAGVVPDLQHASGMAVIPDQTHSCRVAIIGKDGSIPSLESTDALICMCRGLAIGVRTADCVPILMAAPDICAVAAVHAGWKGSLNGIVTSTVERLVSLGADPDVIHAAFGPSICGKCYEVSETLAMSFKDAGFAEAVDNRNVDLQAVNRLRLTRAGIRPENIADSHICTLENTEFPSWRRNRTERRLLTWIELD